MGYFFKKATAKLKAEFAAALKISDEKLRKMKARHEEEILKEMKARDDKGLKLLEKIAYKEVRVFHHTHTHAHTNKHNQSSI